MGTVRGRELSVLIAAVRSEELGRPWNNQLSCRIQGQEQKQSRKYHPAEGIPTRKKGQWDLNS